jgi:hypothetical protein
VRPEWRARAYPRVAQWMCVSLRCLRWAARCTRHLRKVFDWIAPRIHLGVGEQPHAGSSSHVQTRVATCRLEQPHADSSSHMQTRVATCRLEQPRADSSSHMQTRAATCGLEQPHADSSSHMQTRAATCGLVQPHADSRGSHVWVGALAAGEYGAAFSGSSDQSIRVWSGDGSTHLHTLVGRTNVVFSLAERRLKAVAPD